MSSDPARHLQGAFVDWVEFDRRTDHRNEVRQRQSARHRVHAPAVCFEMRAMILPILELGLCE